MTRDLIVSLASGTIFGAGLALGGMTDPSRVRGFLDLFGAWDPTLAFVMGGAVLVMAAAWLIQRRMQRPVFATSFSLPDRSDITLGWSADRRCSEWAGVSRVVPRPRPVHPRLVGGSALFGMGWGIAGLCPGPGFAALAIEPVSAAIFVAAMLGGMLLVRLMEGNA
ncbi:hypothetical protein CHX26_13820 [Porphyrobacter sp. HT-58-2]|uniref:DUF6691 family protein n=1 Tax=Porphyrobacter sp. HT-58-2 TaxID=2023229 RepID=UPI000CDCA60B|nr:DUF6691 family protein [Porphyrobacter sp. HT-58-2]AUX70428.1 hypothetical protein CHX26_13820 [Porphyrobacter sp. HT-58-2]